MFHIRSSAEHGQPTASPGSDHLFRRRPPDRQASRHVAAPDFLFTMQAQTCGFWDNHVKRLVVLQRILPMMTTSRSSMFSCGGATGRFTGDIVASNCELIYGSSPGARDLDHRWCESHEPRDASSSPVARDDRTHFRMRTSQPTRSRHPRKRSAVRVQVTSMSQASVARGRRA